MSVLSVSYANPVSNKQLYEVAVLEDISFTLHFLSLTAYCGETTFFNVFNPQALTFEVTPQLASKPQLRVHQVSDT